MIFAGACDGEIYRLPDAESVEINQELYVPADDLTVVFPYSEDFPSLHNIYMIEDGCGDVNTAIQNGNILFKGIVDEQIISADENGASIMIYSRSMAAVLIDNECSPMMYVNPSVDVICSKHIEPFGVECDFINKHCRSGEMSVAKGSSHYKVAEKFCSEFLNTVPRVDSKGVFRFDIFENVGYIEFDNKYGTKFQSISICENRYNRISRVYVSGDNGYDMIVNDGGSQSMGIVRERYLNLANSETHTLSDADNIIKNGRMKSLSVTLMCEGCFVNKIGYGASVGFNGCEGKKFIVSQVKYTAKNGIEKSKVKCVLKIES